MGLLRRLVFLAALGAAGAWGLRQFVAEGIFIATASMEPTLPVGTHVFVNKLAYAAKRPQRGDIVVFPSPVEKDKDLVKRVIAVGGDNVRIERKRVFVNDAPVNEPYVKHSRPDEMLVGDNLETMTVPKRAVFVLGDNRDESGDSRDWIDPVSGKPVRFIREDALLGRIFGAY